MRFSHKIGKLLSGAAFKSANHRFRRALLKRRIPREFDAAAIIKTIDLEKFEKVCRRYQVENPGDTPAKYLDLPTWLNANLDRIRDLELDIGRSRRVLDIGSGSGYFIYICQLLGHDAVGMDLDDMPMFNETIALLGVKRVVWRIQAFVLLPDLGKKFDLITAHMVCFNNHKVPGLWSVEEWDFFLDDISRHLAPGGRIWFELNREFDGTCYTPELKEFFEARGAQVLSHRIIFNQAPRARAAVAPAAR